MTLPEVSKYARMCQKLNVPFSNNQIGDSGEKLVCFVLSYAPIFNFYFLDAKAPIIDFVGEIADEATPYPFFVQVKTTTEGTDDAGKLKASLEEEKRLKLLARPIPTYLAGADLNELRVFLAPVFDSSKKYSTIPSTHVIKLSSYTTWTKELKLLKEDIIAYWSATDAVRVKPTYTSKLA